MEGFEETNWNTWSTMDGARDKSVLVGQSAENTPFKKLREGN